MKKCPFCKSEIESGSVTCSICKMVLIEKVGGIRPNSNSSVPPPPKSTKKAEFFRAKPKQSKTPKKSFQFPKSPFNNGWLYSIIGSIAITAILNFHASNPLPSPSTNLPVPDTSSQAMSPLSPIEPAYSLPNGTILFSSSVYLKGEGILNISNGTEADAVVKVITSDGKKVSSVYIRAKNNFSIKNIKDGSYRVLFGFGSNWNKDQKKFLANQSAESFDDPFDFKTYTTTSGDYIDTHYAKYDITLNPVLTGTATTSSVNSKAFDQY